MFVHMTYMLLSVPTAHLSPRTFRDTCVSFLALQMEVKGREFLSAGVEKEVSLSDTLRNVNFRWCRTPAKNDD